MMGKKRGKEARGKKFVNKYKEIQEKIKVQRSNQEYSREYEYEMVSTICESTEEGGQQGDELNEDGFQTHFEAKVLEKMNIEGNFENDKPGMKFKECMEIKECKDMEKIDLQESMLEYFELEEGNEEEDFQKDRPSVIQVNHGTSLRNPVDPHLNETKKYSSLSKKVQNFQKDRPSITQETRGTSLCNPVDLHVYETKKSALKSTEAAIILKIAPETAISTCHIVDIAEALRRKGHVTFYNENHVYLVSNLIRKKRKLKNALIVISSSYVAEYFDFTTVLVIVILQFFHTEYTIRVRCSQAGNPAWIFCDLPVLIFAESLPVLQLPNLHDLQYASNAENANKLISFVGLLLKIERLQPTASNRPTTKLTIASDDLTTVAQMMVWKKPDKKYDVSILERYAIVNANINIFKNSTNLAPSLIVPTKLISLGRHPVLPQRQVIRIPNPTIVRDEEGVFINGQIVSINPNVSI
ncbi:hypothetical protein QYM36_009581 [Artemia franciscana]|uniref:Uncharacterized protein n=1 Tax=Artemia franciscana TaxID=6661 RepID=A0AA88L5L3_ARTSF|nr:hypothetical protein QYM36_009581 [Artemia franciscana]